MSDCTVSHGFESEARSCHQQCGGLLSFHGSDFHDLMSFVRTHLSDLADLARSLHRTRGFTPAQLEFGTGHWQDFLTAIMTRTRRSAHMLPSKSSKAGSGGHLRATTTASGLPQQQQQQPLAQQAATSSAGHCLCRQSCA